MLVTATFRVLVNGSSLSSHNHEFQTVITRWQLPPRVKTDDNDVMASNSDDDAAAVRRLSDGVLFALEDVPDQVVFRGAPGLFRLVTINLTDGTRTPVSQTGVEIRYTPGQSTIDRNHSVLYFIGQLKQGAFASCNLTLVGISLVTGAMVSNATIPGADALRADGQIWTAGIAYAEDLDKLVLSISTSANSHIVGTIHPTTGTWKTLAIVDHPTSIGVVNPASMVSYAMPAMLSLCRAHVLNTICTHLSDLTSLAHRTQVYVPGQQTYIFQLGVNHIITQVR